MSNRYFGMIECPHCNKETEFYYADDWGERQCCDVCGKKFKMEIKFTAKKLRK